MNLTSQTWNKEGAFLFDYANEGYIVSKHKINDTSYIIKQGKDVKIVKSITNENGIDIARDYIGKISIKKNEEYIWNYNNYFENNKFIKPYDSLDWVVIGPTKFSSSNSMNTKFDNSYKLTEGDFIKLGKITFLVRKIKINANDILKETRRNNDSNSNSSISVDYNNSNMNINLNNTINDELAIYNRFNNSNYNYIDTNNALLQKTKTKNGNEKYNANINELSEAVNNKLKILYMKLKTLNEKPKFKPFKCRICFCEGSFDGNDPLISPCKCTGSVKYIHLNCFRKWLTSKIVMKTSSNNNIYCYTFKSLECEICKSSVPETVEYRGRFISLLDFKDIEPPYIILQTMYQYGSQNRNYSDFNVIFVISLKVKNFVIIGRANTSDIRINDVSVSRNHSMISYLDGNFYIDDIRSKFGTLLLIQNNILFLPFKEINIQNGKCHLIFKLIRTFWGCFKCFNNKSYEKMSYEKIFNKNDKSVYLQILESYNYNIVDPIEKFSNISRSSSVSDSNYNTINCDDDKKSDIKDKNNDDEQTEKISNIHENIMKANLNFKYIFENSIHSKDIKNGIECNNNNIKEDNNIDDINNVSIEQRPTINAYINNENNEDMKIPGNMLGNKLNNTYKNENNKNNKNLFNLSQKQNESKDVLINDIKNEDSQNYNTILTNKENFSVLNKTNAFRKNANITYVINNFPYKKNYNNSPFINKNIDNNLANTQRQNNNITKKFLEINKSSD